MKPKKTKPVEPPQEPQSPEIRRDYRREIHDTLVDTWRGLAEGRISPQQARAICYSAQLQLNLLKIMERSENAGKGRAPKPDRSAKPKTPPGPPKPWIN